MAKSMWKKSLDMFFLVRLGLDQILPNLEQRIYTDPAPTKMKLKEQLIVWKWEKKFRQD